MEHVCNDIEMSITGDMDFIVPLKQVGLITRAVLESIRLFYRPKRIIVVTAKSEADILNKLHIFWDVGPLICLEEETFFIKNYNISLNDLLKEYDFDKPGDKREPGWWIQQLIKLGSSTQIDGISPVYVVWDGDLVPIRRWRLCEVKPNKDVDYYIAILQSESRSEFNTTQYAKCMEALVEMTPVEPIDGGTFVTHHMVFHSKYVKEMLELMNQTTGENLPWPKLIMSYSRKFYRFSEYKTYATYMTNLHCDEFNHHPLSYFGEGGLRFREANSIIKEILSSCKVWNGGLSYEQVRDYVLSNWKTLCSYENIPAYIQLDHVYGLKDYDINICNKGCEFDVDPSMSSDNLTITSVECSSLSSYSFAKESINGEDSDDDESIDETSSFIDDDDEDLAELTSNRLNIYSSLFDLK